MATRPASNAILSSLVMARIASNRPSVGIDAKRVAITSSTGRTSLVAISSSATSVATDVADELMATRSEEHTSELQSLMRISYAVFCLKKKTNKNATNNYIGMT